MNKQPFIIGILVSLILGLLVVRSYVVNRVSISGIILGDVEKESDFYKTQNAILGEKLFLGKSYVNIASEASKLGFVEEKTSFILTSPLPVALKQ